jgi:hypothetical protein
MRQCRPVGAVSSVGSRQGFWLSRTVHSVSSTKSQFGAGPKPCETRCTTVRELWVEDLDLRLVKLSQAFRSSAAQNSMYEALMVRALWDAELRRISVATFCYIASCVYPSLGTAPCSKMVAEYTCHRCLKAIGVLSRSHAPLTRLSRNQQHIRSFSSTSMKFHQLPLGGQCQGQKRNITSSPPLNSQAASAQTSGGISSTLPVEYQRPLLRKNNLFHPFSKSPSADMRRRAAFIKMHAYCPHPSHQQTRVPTSPHDLENRKVGRASEAPAHVNFECPDCGIPVYCSEQHWADDYEAHLEVCDLLKQINEDDHDLRSERQFHEFEYPQGQLDDILPNLTSWDTLLYTREFQAINNDRSMRQATRLLTYPLTIASVLHELSPYSIREGGRLTPEGLKSLSGTFLHGFPSSPN